MGLGGICWCRGRTDFFLGGRGRKEGNIPPGSGVGKRRRLSRADTRAFGMDDAVRRPNGGGVWSEALGTYGETAPEGRVSPGGCRAPFETRRLKNQPGSRPNGRGSTAAAGNPAGRGFGHSCRPAFISAGERRGTAAWKGATARRADARCDRQPPFWGPFWASPHSGRTDTNPAVVSAIGCWLQDPIRRV